MRDAGLGFGIRESAMRDAERARPCRGRALSLHAPLISPLVLAAWARSQETLGRSTHAWRPAWVTFLRHEAYINRPIIVTDVNGSWYVLLSSLPSHSLPPGACHASVSD